MFAYFFQNFDAVDLRELEIQQDHSRQFFAWEFWGITMQIVESLFSISDHINLVEYVVTLQCQLDQFDIIGVVFNQ
ncbi:MAG: hypothetical protein ER33_10490 [Cyanobium sp. CACIAM 14]|nr:MAG: hypothetical protein ER33_10490 [Cyanobium sp. CACIAM 14]